MRVGVVGGTFDPIHLGHVALAEGARECARLERVLLIPAADPPHRGGPVASAQDRLEMVRLAAGDHEGLEVSDIELRREGPSYTADTLAALTSEMPGSELFLVLGWDAAAELRSWRRPDEVLRLARLIVVPRPGLPPPGKAELRAAGIDPDRTLLCPVITPRVEATEIRERARQGRSLHGLVAPAVEAYLVGRGLYRATPPLT
jgi:nicotinate-nucleotide adenylyltransferase